MDYHRAHEEEWWVAFSFACFSLWRG